MTELVLHKDRCKGCGYCVQNCPQKALFMSKEENQKGYCVVQCNIGRCVFCGICYITCPDYVFEITE